MIPLLPDILLLALGLLILVLDLVKGDNYDKHSNVVFNCAWMGLLGIYLVLFLMPKSGTFLYLGSYKVDGFGILFRHIFILSALFTTVLARGYFTAGADRQPPMRHWAEFMCIVCFCTFGMFTVVSALDLLTLFVGLELATIPLYFLSAYNKESAAGAEASTKYIIMGSVSTAVMLFGFSYLYGLAGSLKFDEIASFVQQNPKLPLLWLSVILIFASIGFKLTLFPFHMWAPDVYHGAPTPVTAFISVSSKATAVAFLMIVVYGPFAALHQNLQPLILLLSGCTMVVGNLGAMKQYSLKRFIAYSSIAQAGYIMLALAGPADTAKTSVIFYLFVYGAANYALFFIVGIIGNKRSEVFRSLRGLGKQSPALAGILVVCVFSLAGIPPVAGFIGKFLLFASAAKSGYYFFVVFAALNSTLSLYCYLLVIKEAYIILPEEGVELPSIEIGLPQRFALGVLTLGIIFMGLVPRLSTRIAEIIQ